MNIVPSSGFRVPRSGQALVEAAFSLGFLFLLIVCSYHTFRIVIDKLRSLDTVYHLSRAYQVDRLTSDLMITRRCFPNGLGMPSQIKTLTGVGTGPGIAQIVFPFMAYRTPGAWKSTMCVALPNRDFFKASWPGATQERSPRQTTLEAEQVTLLTRLHANQDEAFAITDDISATRRARGR